MSDTHDASSSNPDNIAAGVEWLKRIFGDDHVTEAHKMGMDVISVDYKRLLRSGAGGDEIIQWLGEYLRQNGAEKIQLFNGQEAGEMIFTAKSFDQDGLVNSLARLHYELAEHLLEKRFPSPAKPTTPDNTPSIAMDDYIAMLSEALEDIPSSMQDHVRRVIDTLEESQAPKPKAGMLSTDMAITALKEATGVEWAVRKMHNMVLLSTTRNFTNRKELSGALRNVLACSNRDLPDLKMGGGDNTISIPAHYLDTGNLGALVDSKAILYPLFTGKEPESPDYPAH